MIGRLAPGKGIDTLLQAWASIPRSQRTDRRLHVIGDGPLADELAHQMPDGASMLGWRERDEIMRRMLSARALVAPSELYESFGMVLVEAMSAGLPVLVNTAAGAATIVEPPPELLVAPRRHDALAAAIGELTDTMVDQVGAQNRRRFEQCYSESVGVAALQSLYHDAIAGVSP